MLVDHLFQCGISPWPKTAENAIFTQRNKRMDRPTKRLADGQMNRLTDPLIKMHS